MKLLKNISEITCVCYQYNTLVSEPEVKNRLVRCPQGHLVKILDERPLWRLGLFPFLATFVLFGGLIYTVQSAGPTSISSLTIWFFLAVATALSLHRLTLGLKYWLRPLPVKLLARQRFAQAAAIAFGVVLLGILAVLLVSN